MNDRVRFLLLEDGQEKLHIVSNNLLTLPGTGDVIEDPSGHDRFKVQSVTHQNIFNSPGEHSVTIRMIRL